MSKEFSDALKNLRVTLARIKEEANHDEERTANDIVQLVALHLVDNPDIFKDEYPDIGLFDQSLLLTTFIVAKMQDSVIN